MLYHGGDLAREIPACAACHGGEGIGMASAAFPRLASQHAVYIKQQLHAFRDKQRHNDMNDMMQNVAHDLMDEDIDVVAEYIESMY